MISIGLHQRPYKASEYGQEIPQSQTVDHPMMHGEEESANTESHNTV